MFAADASIAQAFLKKALAESEAMRERSRQAAADRRHRRMHSSDTEDLQAQVDQLRLYVAALFQVLIRHGVFTSSEARDLMVRLDASDGVVGDGYHGRDVVTGAELPPEQNPFTDLDGPSN
jgi:hypothetical protein